MVEVRADHIRPTLQNNFQEGYPIILPTDGKFRHYQAKRLAGKNVSEMTHTFRVGRKTLAQSINQLTVNQ